MQDDEAVERFLHEGYRRVVGAVALVSGSLDSAEDAVQEAIVRAWERSERSPEIVSFERWVATVALNLSRSRIRRLVVERRAWPRLLQPEVTPPDPDHMDVRVALARLPRRQREAIVLRYYLDLDVREVAAVMQVEEGTAKSTLARARETLGHHLRLDDPEVETDAKR